jgi:hypothetical protein
MTMNTYTVISGEVHEVTAANQKRALEVFAICEGLEEGKLINGETCGHGEGETIVLPDTAPHAGRWVIGVRVDSEDDANLCMNCYSASGYVNCYGTVWLDSEGYAYLVDSDGTYELQECVSCIRCAEIMAPGTILLLSDEFDEEEE